jgi:dienelactone hydrolase
VIYYHSLFPDPEDLKSITAPMLCHYGTHDPGTTQTEIGMCRDSRERHKKKYEITMYPGAGRGFLNNPSTQSAANRDVADKSVAGTAEWLKKTLA